MGEKESRAEPVMRRKLNWEVYKEQRQVKGFAFEQSRNKLRGRVQIPLGTLRMASVLMAVAHGLNCPPELSFSSCICLFLSNKLSQK